MRRPLGPGRVPFCTDRGSFADYAAGRMDRLGRDLLVQIDRGPAPSPHRLHNSLLVSGPVEPATVAASVAWLHPDTVWIHATELIDAYRVAPILERCGHQVVVIDDDLAAAEELGLLRPVSWPS